ncbi:MAG: flippase [Patescibacteria group bacterium]|jgi:O-antigen/teichoic acid export membrane protein
MSVVKKVLKNTFIQISGKAVAMILGLLTIGVMTRYLGREGFGQYSTIIAFLQFFGIIVDFGLAVIIVQMISSRPDETEKLTSNIFTFRLISALFFFALAPLVVWFFPYPAIIKWGVLVTTWALFFTSLNQLILGLFQRELKMGKATIADVVGRSIIFFGAVLAVYFGWNLLAIMAAVSIGNLVNFLLLFILSRSITRIRLAFDWSVWKEVFYKSWPIGLSIIFNLVYFKADTLILSLIRSQAEVGIYGATYKVLEILAGLPYIFMGLVLPLMSASLAAKDGQRFWEITQKSWDFICAVTLPMMIGGIVLAKKIMFLVAGQGFTDAGPLLQILIIATGAIYFSTIFNHAIIALERQRQILKGFFVTAVVALAGYLWLIPKYSYFAAAWTTVLAEMMILVISIFVVTRATGKTVGFNIFNKALLSSLVMGAVLLVVGWYGGGLLVSLIVGTVTYAAIFYLIGGINKELLQNLVK